MRHLISQYEKEDDFVQTLKWKIENSRNCPSCCIMINRDEGCNKVDCTLCGFSFCWECKSSWSEVTISRVKKKKKKANHSYKIMQNCSYFVCAINKNKSLQLEDEAIATTITQSSTANRVTISK
jgi:uncharacterized ferredoxin-like protein